MKIIQLVLEIVSRFFKLKTGKSLWLIFVCERVENMVKKGSECWPIAYFSSNVFKSNKGLFDVWLTGFALMFFVHCVTLNCSISFFFCALFYDLQYTGLWKVIVKL